MSQPEKVVNEHTYCRLSVPWAHFGGLVGEENSCYLGLASSRNACSARFRCCRLRARLCIPILPVYWYLLVLDIERESSSIRCL